MEDHKTTAEQELLYCYTKRNSLYNKGGNDELLNEEIRRLQKETNYKVIDTLGKEKKIKNN